MINGKRIAVVKPAYNAEKTLDATVRELTDLVDIRFLVDDNSSDGTVEWPVDWGSRSLSMIATSAMQPSGPACGRAAHF
jgi:GT2 family glycosyltransferase